MIGVLVTSHGDLCSGIINSLEMISGKNESVYCVKLDENGIGDYTKRLHSILEEMTGKYSGVLIFSDINGGTPYNECYRYILEHDQNIKLISGMNLPMIIETSLALSYNEDLESLVNLAVEAGKNSVLELKTQDDDNDLDL